MDNNHFIKTLMIVKTNLAYMESVLTILMLTNVHVILAGKVKIVKKVSNELAKKFFECLENFF